jgi:hypothetical protein
MIELRIYCRQLFHCGLPRTIVKVQVEHCPQALLREELLQESSSAQPAEPLGNLQAKVEAILKNAKSSSH